MCFGKVQTFKLNLEGGDILIDWHDVIYAITGVVNSPARPPVLFPIARLKYPERELRAKLLSDHTISVCLTVWGWEYKHRGSKPNPPPQLDFGGIKSAINEGISPRYMVNTVEYFDAHSITVHIQEVIT